MSRIHDALKRAEEEKAKRARLEGTGPQADAVAQVVDPHDTSPAAGVDTHSTPTLPESGKFSKSAELEEFVLKRCTQASWSPDRRTMLFFDRRDPVVGLEEFRTLRSHLYMIRSRQPLQKVLVTSPLPKEGKSFVAANLAQVIARQHERRALLIDADMRMSELHAVLGAPSAPGLSNYLRGEADEFSIVQRGPIENLFFIPGGSAVPNPIELIANGRIRPLLERLCPAFDWIIMDSPPSLPVSDAKLLADYCDGVLLVVRAGATPFDLAQKASQDFREMRLLGAVLNGAENGSVYSAYYYYDNNRPKKNANTKG